MYQVITPAASNLARIVTGDTSSRPGSSCILVLYALPFDLPLWSELGFRQGPGRDFCVFLLIQIFFVLIKGIIIEQGTVFLKVMTGNFL